MYIIVVYDIADPKRGLKVLNYLRTKLIWVQNSVFEGEVTNSGFQEILFKLRNIIDSLKDSVIYYTFDSKNYTTRNVMGLNKNKIDNFI
ncbi:MAG: CRISPR-associated endonuclease Cas2 [Ignavibacteriales bacterium]|jgi:CRISPR-associated protein Cas2|nr:MAG: CRISPR-associated endonuclease Cas2 [Ignavibacteriaceae bacterium]MBW7873771.1 CRISPR-associated endonuclease Cas2 [Ignavibacteria bacterium]MCZ2143079.1 CRISPR-associated endonuclease Cas2 [Ignavibacteriales bacterium]OQY70642.1 MAG: CRISPR-associated endonuclease Cas2 [Ignavibacteriales bacterium UTCHB3]MBV6445748.1 CRISPR-associated endoribonuclease Cas2 [Ignavibacteriaceae bacterium]